MKDLYDKMTQMEDEIVHVSVTQQNDSDTCGRYVICFFNEILRIRNTSLVLSRENFEKQISESKQLRLYNEEILNLKCKLMEHYLNVTFIIGIYHQLFRLFSTTYFSQKKDNTKERTNIQSHTLVGIAIGWSDVANGLQVYDPTTKELYTMPIYKINGHNVTKAYFNLQCDGVLSSL